MSVPQRLLVFVAMVVAAFVLGFGIGGAVDPVLEDDSPTPTTMPEHGEHGAHTEQGS